MPYYFGSTWDSRVCAGARHPPRGPHTRPVAHGAPDTHALHLQTAIHRLFHTHAARDPFRTTHPETPMPIAETLREACALPHMPVDPIFDAVPFRPNLHRLSHRLFPASTAGLNRRPQPPASTACVLRIHTRNGCVQCDCDCVSHGIKLDELRCGGIEKNGSCRFVNAPEICTPVSHAPAPLAGA